MRKIFTSERIVRTLAVAITLFYFLLLYFPIYYLFITSVKDGADVYADPPILYPSTSHDYYFVVDYDKDVWDNMSESEKQTDQNIVLWSNFREFTAERIGQMKVVCRVDGEIVGSAVLEKQSYNYNRPRIWLTGKLLSADMIAPKLEEINEKNAVTYNQVTKIPKESKWLYDQGIPEMIESVANYQNDISGNVSEVFRCVNWGNVKQNFVAAWEYPKSAGIPGGLLSPVKNSLKIAILMVGLRLVVCGMAGYALSMLYSKRAAKNVMLAFMATSMIPTTVTIMAAYVALMRIGLDTSIWGVILPSVAGASDILLFKGNFDGIPRDLVDAAYIDGATEGQVLTRVVLPLSRPIFMTIGLTGFTGAWAEFFWSNIILRDRADFTVPMLMKFIYASDGGIDYPMLMAMSLIVSIPTIIIMIIGHKDLSKGMVFTGLKG